MAGMRYQPQGLHRADQSNQVGRSLVMAFSGGASLREVVGNGIATSRGSAQSIKAFPGGLAYDLRAVNTATVFSAVKAAAQLTSDQSLIFDIVVSGAPSGSIPAIGGLWRSTTQNDYWLVVERDTADSMQVSFRIAGIGSTRSFNIGASSLYGRRLIIAASITRGPSGSGTVYFRAASDGVILYDLSSTYSGSGSTDVTPTGTEYVSIGSESIENPTRNSNTIQYGQYHLGRIVSAAEVASLSAQQWQMYAATADDDEPVAGISSPDASGIFSASTISTSISAPGLLSNTGYSNASLSSAGMSASGMSGNTPSGALSAFLIGASMACNGAQNNIGTVNQLLSGTSMLASGNIAVPASGAFLASLASVTMITSGYQGEAAPSAPLTYRRRAPHRTVN